MFRFHPASLQVDPDESKPDIDEPSAMPPQMSWPLRFTAILLFLAGILTGRGDTVSILDPGTTRLDLGPSLTVFRDTADVFTLKDARKAYKNGRFQPGKKPRPTFGFTQDTIWARFEVRHDSTDERLWFAELQTSRMDELDWYLIRPSGTVEHVSTGNYRDHSPGMVDGPTPVFQLRMGAGERVEVFLRIRSETSIHIPLSIWRPDAFVTAKTVRDGLLTSFFGYLAALILLSLVLSLFTRDRGYAIYSLSLAGIFIVYFILTGYYTWLNLPGKRLAVHSGIICFIEITLTLMLVYLRYFFELARTMPGIDRWVLGMIRANPVLAAILLLGPYRIMDQILMLQISLLGMCSLAVSMRAWWQGNRVARFYTLAWLSFWLLYGISTAQILGWFPQPTLPELQAVLGVAISVTLFFLAMGDRVRQVRENMQLFQQQVLELEKKASHELQQQLQQQQQLIRDLHDGIGGLTTNVVMLAEMGSRAATNDKDRGCFQQIRVLASEGGAEVRSLMSSMDARDIQWADLIVECRRHATMVLAGHNIAFELSVSGDVEQPGPGLFPGMSLFRVFKESLTNVVKHSGAKKVAVRMEFEKNRFRMTVKDDGRGIPPEKGSGRGLKNMTSRIEELGGTVTCQNRQGTELAFDIPLPMKSAAAQE